jgi:hypothetical protein
MQTIQYCIEDLIIVCVILKIAGNFAEMEKLNNSFFMLLK